MRFRDGLRACAHGDQRADAYGADKQLASRKRALAFGQGNAHLVVERAGKPARLRLGCRRGAGGGGVAGLERRARSAFRQSGHLSHRRAARGDASVGAAVAFCRPACGNADRSPRISAGSLRTRRLRMAGPRRSRGRCAAWCRFSFRHRLILCHFQRREHGACCESLQ